MSSAFLAFKEIASRSKRISEILKLDIIHIKDNFPYIFSYFYYSILILKNKYKNIILQLTQGPPLLFLILLKKFLKFNLILDVHTGFLYYINIKGKILNLPFRNLIKNSNLIILHNESMLSLLYKELKNKVLILSDPLIEFNEKININKKIKVFIPLSFRDEPLNELLKAIDELKGEYLFLCTTRKRKYFKNLINLGYLKYEDYLKILNSSDIILALTKREYTTLSIAFEAISLGKCIISSNTKALRNLLGKSAAFVNNDSDSIKKALIMLKEERHRKELEKKVSELKNRLKREQDRKIEYLRRLLLK